jgi:hypothetical protein
VTPRWGDYIMGRDDTPRAVEDLWLAAAGKGRIAYILGEGFDPRALVGIRRLVSCGCATDLHLISIGLQTRGTDQATLKLAAANAQELTAVAGLPIVRRTHVAVPEVEEPSSAGLKLARSLIESKCLDDSDLIIVDVSALPSSIHFPVIGAILKQADVGNLSAEVQVVICHNAELDEAIVEAGIGPAAAIGGFSKPLTEDRPSEIKVWAPVIGRGQGPSLQLLYDHLEPDEVCPVVPFPSRRPRRADDLVLEHRQLLIERIEVEPRNLIYADETNPFDLYRTLSRLQQQYSTALAILGPVSVVLSCHASKLLSLGVFLAAYEHSLTVMSAGASEYSLDPGIDLTAIGTHDRLVSLWLDGSPYRV